ncbi:MAG: TetR/AcrR family transcriptional regulator [Deltaproteobacteria bacterium]|nr:TetR/AcrR family transcriptional regulator [Deltaproteobacteria bacterium]
MQEDKTEQKRAQILAAAMDVFAEKGYHKTRVSDIAERLAMGHGTFYRYFRNKLDIFDSVIDLVVDKIRAVAVEEDPESTNTADEFASQILRIGSRLYEIFMRDTRLARIIFYEALGVDRELNEKMDRVMATIHQYTELYLRNGMKKGFLQQDLDVPVLARSINAMIFGGAKDVMAAEEPEAMGKRWIMAISRLLMFGVRKPASGEA